MKKRIFIADDDPGLQDIFKIIFEMEGYEATFFMNVNELLSATNNYPDVYLLDKQLGGADGLDACRKLKQNKRTRSIPVIIVSGTEDIKILSEDAGADDFLEKPFKKADLLSTVARNIASAPVRF